MARRESDKQNELKIHDNLSDSDITLLFRMPTTKERQNYQNMVLGRKRNKINYNQAAARLEFGLKILTGFNEGDFERKIGDRHVPFSYQEGTENYYPEWREWIGKHASDLVMLLAAHVYDVSAVINEADDMDDSDDEASEDIEGK